MRGGGVLSACACIIVLGAVSQAPLAQDWPESGYWTGLGGSDVGESLTGPIERNKYDYDLAVDCEGRPHLVWVSYDASRATEIRYAFWDGERWRGMPDEDGPTALGQGGCCAISLTPQGLPYICYVGPMGPGQGPFRLGLYCDPFWQALTFSDSERMPTEEFHVLVDELSRPHFLYPYYDRGLQKRYLYYCFYNGSSIQGLGGSNEGTGVFVEELSYPAKDSISFALDSRGFPHVVWGLGGQLFYKFWDGDEWIEVDCSGVFELEHVYRPQIAIDSQDRPHIMVSSVQIERVNNIYYAYWDGEKWASLLGSNTGLGITGYTGFPQSAECAKFVLDKEDRINLCWVTDDTLIYFQRWDGTGFSSPGWADVGRGVLPPPEVNTDSSRQDVHSSPRLALGPDGQPYVAYAASFYVLEGPNAGRHGACRLRTFCPDRAPYPLLALDTDRRLYPPESTSASVMLGINNEQDEWIETQLFLAIYVQEGGT